MKILHDFPYQHVLVLGLAKSGTAAAHLLLDSGVRIRINDFASDADAPEVKALTDKGAEAILGAHPLSALDDIDLIVKNPGISYENILLVEAAQRKIPVVTEVELAHYVAPDNEMLAITGSNGKTTTTTLVYEMLQKSKQPVRLAGNIGIVASEVARQAKDEEKLVLELSSFQLMGIQKFKPHIAALLNLFEAHLDYHGSMDAYVNAKKEIFKNQTERDFLIFNAENKNVLEAVQEARASLVPFSVNKQQPHGAWADEQAVYFKDQHIIDKKEILLPGDHNLENVLAAVCIACLSGASIAGIQQVLKTFTGVEHRLQFVRELHDRVYYNDSKATNILATEKALQSFDQPTILLAGGLDRGNSFDELLASMKNVKAMVLFGETKEKLKQTANKANIPVAIADTVTDATKTAHEMSSPGDVILLSPACASWDQYKTFEERGNMFVQAVHTLQ